MEYQNPAFSKGRAMLEINYPDKILAGVNQSYTLVSDEGTPDGSISIDGTALHHRVIPLGPPKGEPSGTPVMKYKVSFFIPDGSAGKSLRLSFRAGESAFDDEKEISND